MQLGKYELIEQLGQGGFGIVYKAEDPTLDRLVALKVLHPQLTVDPRFIENFKREARLMAMVSNSNVVSIHEIGEVDGRIFIAMQYLPGGNLDQKIKKDGPIPFEEALEITRQIAKGLEAGHRKNLVHRDVKPANILFDEDGNALIGDFGVAHTVQLSSMGTMSQTSTGVGTPSYRPPELWNGTPPPSPATDQYSLACVFYEMISGKILFDGDTTEQIMVKLLINGPDFEIIKSEELKAVLGKAVAKEPKQRYGSMNEFLASLAATNEVLLPQPEPEPVIEPTARENLSDKHYVSDTVPDHAIDEDLTSNIFSYSDTNLDHSMPKPIDEEKTKTKRWHPSPLQVSLFFILIQILITVLWYFEVIWHFETLLIGIILAVILAIGGRVFLVTKRESKLALFIAFNVIGITPIIGMVAEPITALLHGWLPGEDFILNATVYLSPISFISVSFLISEYTCNTLFRSESKEIFPKFGSDGPNLRNQTDHRKSYFSRINLQALAFFFGIFPSWIWIYLAGMDRVYILLYIAIGIIWIIASVVSWMKQLKATRAKEMVFDPPA